MISLIIALVILVLIIIISIYGINFALRKAVDSFVGKKEDFQNLNEINKLNQIPNLDSCKKIDKPLKNKLNTQTGTNIPLNPIYYNNHVGQLNMFDNEKNNELKQGGLCAYQNELLYDGIWKSVIDKKNNGFLNQNWLLSNGDIKNDYICSNKFIRLNKTLPNDYIDCHTPTNTPLETEIYFNDKTDDPLDLGIDCFPSEFNQGIIDNKQ